MLHAVFDPSLHAWVSWPEVSGYARPIHQFY